MKRQKAILLFLLITHLELDWERARAVGRVLVIEVALLVVAPHLFRIDFSGQVENGRSLTRDRTEQKTPNSDAL